MCVTWQDQGGLQVGTDVGGGGGNHCLLWTSFCWLGRLLLAHPGAAGSCPMETHSALNHLVTEDY